MEIRFEIPTFMFVYRFHYGYRKIRSTSDIQQCYLFFFQYIQIVFLFAHYRRTCSSFPECAFCRCPHRSPLTDRFRSEPVPIPPPFFVLDDHVEASGAGRFRVQPICCVSRAIIITVVIAAITRSIW